MSYPKLSPAFWTPKPDDDEDIVQGMSLRDYFAGKAMQGMHRGWADPSDMAHMAMLAYKMADAMLAERAK